MGALIHVKSNTIGDFTGTVTVPNSAGGTETKAATDLVRPSDWNSVHQFNQTISGNTSGDASTASGTNLVFGGSNGVTLNMSTAAGAATIWVDGGAPLRTLYPYPPASTVSQTMGAIGVSTASMFAFPYQVLQPVQFNALRLHWSASLATTTVAASQTITHQWGLYTKNGASLSQLSSGSYSMALSQSSISGTLSLPNSTNTAGYTYTTVAWSSTATAQSLVGTAGQRLNDLMLGGTGVIQPGIYWVVLHQRQVTAGAAAGLSTALVANVMYPFNNVGPMGSSTAAFTTNASRGLRPFGVFTSTNSAGHSGTALLGALAYSGFANTISNMPVIAFASTQ